MSTLVRPTAVVFDLDGLMFNTEELYQDVGAELLRRRGRVFSPELLDKMMGRPGYVSLQLMIDEHALADTVPQLQQESDEIFFDILATRLAPMPGLVELLAALEAAEIPKAIATSSRRAFLANVLGRFEMAPRFAVTLAAEDVVCGKPNPDCRAAVVAGTHAVAVPGGHSRRHDFTGARFIAESLADRRIYEALGLS
jgi:beta-phosphoglucomutase-like phosphatase (HAD superfamily)